MVLWLRIGAVAQPTQATSRHRDVEGAAIFKAKDSCEAPKAKAKLKKALGEWEWAPYVIQELIS